MAWAIVGNIRGPQGLPGDDGSDGSPGAPGNDGAAATIAVGTVTTGAPGTDADVVNSGTSLDAVLDFTIPRGTPGAAGTNGTNGSDGADGADGAPGAAATIAVHSTTTGAPGTSASVTNVGTSSAASLDFTIPRGDVGAMGSTGPAGADSTVPGPPGSPGPSGVISVTAPIHNAGTSTAADLSLEDLTAADFAAASVDGTAGTASLRTLGTGAQQATAGNDARLSDSRPPTGAAGGGLTGTYPNPGLVAATGSVAGSMSATDKAKLDAATAVNTASTLVQRGSSGEVATGVVTTSGVVVLYAANGSALLVTGTALAATAGGGADAADVVTITGAAGQASSTTSLNAHGGQGAGIGITAGSGGAVTGATGATSGGAGGAFGFNGGAGGANASTAGTGGAGGGQVSRGGVGGNVSAAGGIGGVGGQEQMAGGNGGSATAAAGAGAGGTGGPARVYGGDGGSNSSASGTRGTGGPAYVYGGHAGGGVGAAGAAAPAILDWDGFGKSGGVAVGKGTVGAGLEMDVDGRVAASGGYNGLLSADMPAATTGAAGSLSAADKTKLDSVASGASVSSVGLTVPSEFSVSGSPITGSGTLAISKATQTANQVYAGPSSGSAAAPAFRAVVPADLPAATTSAAGSLSAADKTKLDAFANAWTTWTPTLGQGAAVTITVNYAEYSLLGKVVCVQVSLTLTSGGTGGNQFIVNGVPSGIAPVRTGLHIPVGTFVYYDASANYFSGAVIAVGANDLRFVTNNNGAAGVYFGNVPAMTLASGDQLNFTAMWKVA